MADEPEKPHTVKAGIMDAMLGNRGPNGELMHQGKPALVIDLPDDEDDDDLERVRRKWMPVSPPDAR